MIGIFDSGFGGLYTLNLFRNFLPQYDYIFFADSKNTPYGNKTKDEVKNLTFEGLNYLFDNGAKIVILACNTASAAAIKHWQKEYPQKKVLSVTIPGVEKIIDLDIKKVGILATSLTVNSNIFPNKYGEICKGNTEFYQVAATDLVMHIENGDIYSNEFTNNLSKYLSGFPDDIQAIVLGCTHFPIIAHHIQTLLPEKIIIDPSYEAVYKFISYLENHKNIKNSLSTGGNLHIQSSGDISKFYDISDLLGIDLKH